MNTLVTISLCTVKGFISYLLELESSSVPLLQEIMGLGAAFGLHSISTRPFFAPSSLCLTGLNSNEGAPTDNTKHQHCHRAWVYFNNTRGKISSRTYLLSLTTYMLDANPFFTEHVQAMSNDGQLHINKEENTGICISIHPPLDFSTFCGVTTWHLTKSLFTWSLNFGGWLLFGRVVVLP